MALIPQLYETTITGTSDGVGNCTFKIPAPAASNMVCRYTVALPDAGSGVRFLATISAGPRWGPWFGPQPFGPITYDAGLDITVFASGLRILTTYTLELVGLLIDASSALVDMPLPTGVTAITGTDVIYAPGTVDVVVPAGGLVNLEGAAGNFFPVGGYTLLRASLLSHGLAAVFFTFTWYDAVHKLITGRRQMTLGNNGNPGSQARFALPHLGEFLRVQLANGDLANNTSLVQLVLEQETQPFERWSALGVYGAPGQPVAAGQTITATGVLDLFTGIAKLAVNAEQFPAWTVQLQVQSFDLTWQTVLRVSNRDGGPHPILDVFIPPQPIRVLFTNSSQAAGTVDVFLTYDLAHG